MRRTAWTGWLLAAGVALAGPAAANARGERTAAAALAPVDYRLPPKAEDHDARWQLPDIEDEYERRPTPMIRWRVNKVKLRVPIG